MNCLRCNTPNEDGAKFCKNCGMDLNFIPSYKTQSSSSGDPLLMIFIFISLVSNVGQFIIQRAFDNWYEGPGKYLQGALWMISNLAFILLPLAIKDRTMKTIGLVIVIPLILYWMYSNITFLLR